MGGKSYQAGRPKGKAQVGEKCPQCGEGVLTLIDENYISCDSCAYDIPIKEEKDDGEVQGA